MKILGLYHNDCAKPLFEYLQNKGNEIVLTNEKLDISWCKQQHFDLTISYTYRYILSKEIIDALNGNVVNLHNSFLPFNRGASPNIWSLIEETPRGVTLHYMDTELDKGYIIAQKLITTGDGDTLSSSYNNLNQQAIELFCQAFQYYPYWQEMKKKAQGKGSYHSVEDTKQIEQLIDNYEMKIEELRQRYKEWKMR